LIPFWLIVYGVLASILGLMKAIANIVISCKKHGDKKVEFEGIDCFSAVLLFFLFGWFIAGMIKKVLFIHIMNINFN
jgi:hypothetical protein